MSAYNIGGAGRISLVIIGSLWFSALASYAVTTNYYVATNGPGGNFLSWDQAASNIQQAIDATADGDVVNVSNGVYDVGGVANYPTGGLLTNRVAIYKAITVKSFNNDPTNTIIKGRFASNGKTNGDDAVRCVFMTNGASLIGFTLTNGAATTNINGVLDGMAGAVLDYGNILLSNCVITGNACGTNSSYLVFWRSQAGATANRIASNCKFINNVGLLGSVTLTNCIYRDNRSGPFRAGLSSCNVFNSTIVSNGYLSGDDVRVDILNSCNVFNSIIGWNSGNYSGGLYFGAANNCLIIGNYSIYAGGVGGGASISNCTVVGNRATGAGYGGGIGHVGGSPALVNCIVYGNYNSSSTDFQNWSGAATFINCCTTPTNTGGAAGTGFITNNPLFISAGSGYGTTYSPGNLRLSSSSPCVNTGTNSPGVGNWTDLDGMTRIRYGTVDMGCYERINSGTIIGLR